MKRECILSEKELTQKRKIIQRNKIKKILNEAEQLTQDEMSKLDHGELLDTLKIINKLFWTNESKVDYYMNAITVFWAPLKNDSFLLGLLFAVIDRWSSWAVSGLL